MSKLKSILSLLIIIAITSLPISAMSFDVPYNNDLIIFTENETTTEPSESNSDITTNSESSQTDNTESNINNTETEPSLDTSENANNNDTIDTDNPNNDIYIIENKPDESKDNAESDDDNELDNDYENIDALSGTPDFFNRGTITYNLMGGTDGPNPNPEFALVGYNVPLNETEPTHAPADLNGEMTNVVFIGWSLTEPSGILESGDPIPGLVTTVTVILNENVTVYAVWQFDEISILTHDVTFNLNGGNVASDTEAITISIVENETIGAKVPAPSRANHRFNGWRENNAGQILSSDYVAALTIDESRSFTASWTRINTGGGWVSLPILPIIPDEPEEEPDIIDEPEQEEPPQEEEIPSYEPTEEPPIEEPHQDEPPVEELPEIEQPPYETYEPEEIPTIEIEPEIEEYIEEEIIEIEEPQEEEIIEEIYPVIVEFTLTNIGNPINGNIRSFRIINRSFSGLQFLSGTIPAFTRGNGVFYNVKYRTNLNSSLRNMANNIPADRPFTLLTPQLNNGEIITEIIIEFDMVPVGLRMDDTIIYRFIVLDENNVENHWDIVSGETTQRNFFIGATLHNINELSNRENIYDAESWANLQTTIISVQEILSNPNSTLKEIEDAYFMLQQAMSELSPMYSPATTTATPFEFGGMLIALLVLVSIMGALLAIIKLLKYKKRMILNPPNQVLA